MPMMLFHKGVCLRQINSDVGQFHRRLRVLVRMAHRLSGAEIPAMSISICSMM